MAADTQTRAWTIGGAAGCLTALLVIVLVACAVVFVFWGAYEADLTEMGAEGAIPIGLGCGLFSGLFFGGGALYFVRKMVLRRSAGSPGGDPA